MLLSKEVEVILSSGNIGYYEELGYKIIRVKDKWGRYSVSKGSKIKVKVEDLAKGSHVEVECLCDYCLEKGIKTIVSKGYRAYLKGREVIDKDCCNDGSCQELKRKDVLMKLYGVNHTSLIESTIEKTKQTNLNKYGVTTNLKLEECKEQIIKTNLEKYGYESPMQNEGIKNKAKETMKGKYGVEHALQFQEFHDKAVETTKEKYGVDYYTKTDEYKINQIHYCQENYGVDNLFQSEIIKERSKLTCLNNFGVEHPMQSLVIKQKAIETMYGNGTQKSSKQQRYIYELLNNINDNYKLNYLVSKMFLDIANPIEKIYIEYDGGFHDGSVKCGTMMQEQFDLKEMKRSCQLSDWGWKEIRIISEQDKLPSDKILIKMIAKAIEYINRGHHYIKFNIDNLEIINSQGKFDCDFGELRIIK